MCLRCRKCRDMYPAVCETHLKILDRCGVCISAKALKRARMMKNRVLASRSRQRKKRAKALAAEEKNTLDGVIN